MEMRGLQNLEVFFEGPPESNGVFIKRDWLKGEGVVFKGIRNIRVREFKIVLPYAESDLELDVGGSRCQFRRREDLGRRGR